MDDLPTIIHNEIGVQDEFYSLAFRFLEGMEDKVIYCLEEEKFYLYSDGSFKRMYDIELLNIIGKKVPKIYKYPAPRRTQIIDNLKLIKYIHLERFNWSELLNLNNGMVNPFSCDLLKHDTTYMSTIQISYNFDEKAQCPLWLKTLNEILENDQEKIELLQEFFGYCLTKDIRYEKALLLLGDSRSGKSTILNTLKNMIGINNCSSVPIKNITNPQYTDMMVGKLVNIDSDVSAKAVEFEDEFKKITTGEEVTSNQKYVKPFSFKPFCKIVMAANDFPRITDHSSAFYKRLILIPCDRVFEKHEQNINLRSELLKELPGILLWSMQGLNRLNNNNGFSSRDFMTEAINELREESNPVDVFLNEFITTDVSGLAEINKGDLYIKYKEWSQKNTHFILSSAKFSQCVFRKYAKFTPKNTMNKTTNKRVWKNIVYINRNIDSNNSGWHE